MNKKLDSCNPRKFFRNGVFDELDEERYSTSKGHHQVKMFESFEVDIQTERKEDDSEQVRRSYKKKVSPIAL